MALMLQREAAAVWTELSHETSVVGRDWERWRALVAVARLLERHGVEGLEQDVRTVMAAYHDGQGVLETQSRVILVIRALMRLAHIQSSDMWTFQDISDISSETLHITASQIVTTLKEVMADDDGERDETDEDQASKPWYHSSRSVWRILSKLRLKDIRDPSTKSRDRYRVTSPKEIFQLALAHHLVHPPKETSETSINVHMSDADPNAIEEGWL